MHLDSHFGISIAFLRRASSHEMCLQEDTIPDMMQVSTFEVESLVFNITYSSFQLGYLRVLYM